MPGGLPGKDALVDAASRDATRTLCDSESLPFAELSYHFAKCFDSLPRRLLIQLAGRLGMPRRVGDAILRFLEGSERHVVFRGWAGPSISGDKGVPQGNALSVLLVLVWTSVWHQQISSMLTPVASCAAFYDDISIASEDVADLRVGLGCTACFAKVWGVVLNMEKSCKALNGAALVQWDLGDAAVPRAGFWNFVGVCLGTRKHSHRTSRRLLGWLRD